MALDKVIQFRVSKAEYASLETEADSRKITVSQVIRERLFSVVQKAGVDKVVIQPSGPKIPYGSLLKK